MKKILALLLVVAMAAMMFVACGEAETTTEATVTTETTVTTEATTATTEATTVATTTAATTTAATTTAATTTAATTTAATTTVAPVTPPATGDDVYVDVNFENGAVADAKGNATFVNVGTPTVGEVDVKFNGVTKKVNALQIKASGNYVIGTFAKLGTADAMNGFLANGFSVEAFYIDNSSVISGIVCMTEANTGWGIADQTDNKPYFITGSGSGYNAAYATKGPASGELVHVVATYDPAAKAHTIYVNGVECSNLASKYPGTNVPGVLGANKTSQSGVAMFNVFCLGADLSPSRAGDFLADDLTIVDAKIYNKALTAGEVANIYNAVVTDWK